MIAWEHPTGRVPRSVDVVALGASCQSYMRHSLNKGRSVDSVTDEVWTVNRGIRLFAADLAFVLDEIEPEIRRDPAYGLALKKAKIPIISTVYTDSVVDCHAFPAREILDCIRQRADLSDPYWHNSMPMVVAYAWFIGVKQLTLWGCDYTRPDGQVIEDDRSNLEYWIGWGRAMGMRIGVPSDTTLMNQYRTGGGLRIYGLVDQSRAREWLGLD